MIRFSAVCLSAMVFMITLGGCSRRKPITVDCSLIPGLKPESVLMTINGQHYTYKDFCEDVEFRYRLFLHGAKKDVSANEAAKLKSQLVKSLFAEAIDAKIVEQVLAEESVTTAELGPVRAKYIAKFTANGESIEEFMAWIDDLGFTDKFTDMIANETALNRVFAVKFKDDVAVSRDDILRWHRKIEVENARSDATNALLFAQATNLCIRARQGEDFAGLADRYSQDSNRQPGGAMGLCDRSDFFESEAEVWDMINQMKPGEISDPVVTDDGITIFKCVRKVDKNEETDRPAVELSRICLHRRLKYPDYTDDEIRVQLLEAGRKDAMGKFIKPLRAAAVVDFPSGTKWFPKKLVRFYNSKEKVK